MLCDYSDTYILVKENITVPNLRATNVNPDNRNKKITFKNCAPSTDCISEINNTEIDHTKDTDVVLPMYNLTECSDNYSKISMTSI